MQDKPFNVLFICRHNSARSLMAEALLAGLGRRRFAAYSAGFEPATDVHPLTLETIRNAGLRDDGLAAKGLERFTAADAPTMDFVFVLNEEDETLPTDVGAAAMRAHWPFPDPLATGGSHAEQAAAFADVFRMIRRRIDLFVELPVERLDRLALQRRVDGIGQD